MTIEQHLDSVAELCKLGAQRTLDSILNLGPRPDDPIGAFLWDQKATRLQGQLNSLSAMVSKLTAGAIIEGLREYEADLIVIEEVSIRAKEQIKEIEEISDLLGKLAKVLDFGLALLAAAAAPSSATIAAVIKAGESVIGEQTGTEVNK